MWDLIQPEVRIEEEMRLWRAQVLKGQFMPQDFYVYPEGNREPLTIHEELWGHSYLLGTEFRKGEPRGGLNSQIRGKGRLNPVLAGAPSKK